MAGSASRNANGSTAIPQAMKPDTLLKVVWLVIKGIVKSIPRKGLWMLVKAVATFVVIFFINYYVIAVKNQGFGSGDVLINRPEPWYSLFNYGSNRAAFTLLSFLLPLLLSSLWTQIRMYGIKRFFSRLFHLFHWTGYCFSHAGRFSLPALLLFTAAVLPLGFFANNNVLFTTLVIGQLFAFSAQNETLSFLFLDAGWKDYQRVFKRKTPLRDLNPGIGGLFPLGLVLGSILLLLFPHNTIKLFSIIGFVLLTALGVLLLRSSRKNLPLAGLLFFVAINFMWMALFQRSFADDAGQDELGSFSNYIRDPGGQMVLKGGILPGGLGALGSLIGQVIGAPELLGDIFGKGAESTSRPASTKQEGEPALAPEPSVDGQQPASSDPDMSPDGTVTGPDGTITMTNPDGSVLVKSPEGTIVITTPDGTVTTIEPDGSKTVRERMSFAAGSPGFDDPDKDYYQVTHTAPDGTETVEFPDGSKTVRERMSFAAGSPGFDDPDKDYYQITHTEPDGTETVEYPDGSKSITHPDGTTTEEPPPSFRA